MLLSIFVIFVLIFGVLICGTAFWIWMLIDSATNKTIKDDQKLMWLLIIIFTHLIGALLYYFIGRKPGYTTPYPMYAQPQQPLPYQPQQPQFYQPQPPAYQQGYQAVPQQHHPATTYQPQQNSQSGSQQGQSAQQPYQTQGRSYQEQAYDQPQAKYPEQWEQQ